MSKRDRLINQILVATMELEGKEFIEADGSLSYHGFNQGLVDAHRKKKGLAPKDVRTLTYGELKDIFVEEFVQPNGISKLPDELLPIALDFSFNSGAGNAARTIQRMVGAKEDGIIGKKTLKKIDKYTGGDVQKFIDGLSNARIEFIDSAAETNVGVAKFQEGIKNRIEAVRQRELDKLNP